MFSFKSLLALVSVSALFAVSVNAEGNSTTCDFTMAPTPDLGVDALQSSVNFAIGSTIGEEYPSTVLTDVNTLTSNADGTYTVHSVISVTDQDGASVGQFVETWVGQSLYGIQAYWLVDAAKCA
ncbi:uncharacterized protein STEHIDRAFT_109208 [Stereum hirsutum FP-91666 SS1]|uniref:uncharacterized protein n=1 Tax=Stereum hirsutum (strain FP-91666) TaxID=721885 RepID=UPI000440D8B1|nr:uncharacterized protein STEHIDRAFT_109208 [Stereum hirsutum FP-91666 SS1]EIM88887.1 hypothetical protein STEHIDRAFT_109208 [Stereum hirsutum FP-91666 SS1]